MTRSYNVNQAVAIGKVNSVFAGGIKTNGPFLMQVINRIIKELTAINAFFYFNNAVEIYLH
jgi:hypothetical protein